MIYLAVYTMFKLKISSYFYFNTLILKNGFNLSKNSSGKFELLLNHLFYFF
jgi:hypothetical protein